MFSTKVEGVGQLYEHHTQQCALHLKDINITLGVHLKVRVIFQELFPANPSRIPNHGMLNG